jgi:DNA gyrase subunit A
MSTAGQHISERLIEEELSESYLNYSMSVITSRALPDIRDGLKPVNRRVIYGMDELGLQHNRSFRKSARIVGDVLGKYHPHGDSSVYMAMVRMAQEFSLRYPLVHGQGNFGSIDGDSPAAMRYTEAKMSKITQELIRDLDKDTVDFRENFDETLQEPTVMPTVLPNLILNGASGIAVGMATNIPPHNLTEVLGACLEYIDSFNDESDTFSATVDDLMKHISGPDFPTGGIIYGSGGIKEAYETGRGKVIVRGRAVIEQKKGNREALIITEIPFQLNKLNLIEKIVDLVRDKKIEGISDINDESDRDGMRIVIDIKRDGDPNIVLNQLYKYTQLQSTFGCNMLALVNGRPQMCNLIDFIHHFILHRHEVIVRRTEFELRKAKEREHILQGLKIALDNIDEVIKIIRGSSDPQDAREKLMTNFGLSEIQSRAILDMRLQRLTALEVDKIEQELREILALIAELESILASKPRRMVIIYDELKELLEKYGDARRTEIVANYEEFSIEDMIAEEDMVITISNQGLIKRFPVSGFRKQNRGGRGSTGAGTREEDFVEHLFIASTHEYMMFFTDRGRCYWLKVHEIPQMGKTGKGRSIVNMINIEKGENVRAFVKVKEFSEDQYIIMATQSGTVKKTKLSAYGNIRKNGINAITIRENDALVDAKITDGTNHILLGTSTGMAIRFDEEDCRDMGRTAAGVRGIRLRGKDFVVGMVVVKRSATILVVAENGFGKRTNVEDYRLAKRGGMGVITLKTTERNGRMISIMEVVDEEDLMIVTNNGVINRQSVAKISTVGRNTQGVRLIRLDDKDLIAAVARVPKEEVDPDAVVNESAEESSEAASTETPVAAKSNVTKKAVEEDEEEDVYVEKETSALDDASDNDDDKDDSAEDDDNDDDDDTDGGGNSQISIF